MTSFQPAPSVELGRSAAAGGAGGGTMPFWIYGSDNATGLRIDPFFSGADTEQAARAQAEAHGIRVESLERYAEPGPAVLDGPPFFADEAHRVMQLANREAHRTNHEY